MTTQSAPNGILHGIRVLDLSRMLSGPYCTMMLADHGAEVIKIEEAGGDTSRNNGPYRDDDPDHEWAGYFVSLNRSKKSVVLDLKSDKGKAALKQLVANADILVENFRPGVMERLGLGYETLAEVRPGLVYAAIRGFGDPRSGASPYADWPSYDIVAQAMGGILSQTGPDADTPTKIGPGVGDVFAGMMMSFGIMAALRQAEATGKSQFVDVGMYDAILSLCERAVYFHDIQGTVAGPEGNEHPFLAPFALYPARDGQVAIGIVDDTFWRALTRAMGTPDLADDPRYATRADRTAHRRGINDLVASWTARHSKAQLATLLGGVVPFGPLNTIADIVADPHVAARRMLTQVPHPNPAAKPWTVAANPLRFTGAPLPAARTPSALGADTQTYLAEPAPVPMSDEEKRSLRNAFGAFPTGVTVVTTRQPDGTPRGFTANSFTSVSLDPPMLLICIAKNAYSCETFMAADHFAVNILSEDQKNVSGLFASRQPDKFENADWYAGHADMPVISGSLASLVCSQEKSVDAGDHIILIGRVEDYATNVGAPLGYHGGSYFRVGAEDPLVKAAARASNVRIGAVLRRDQEIMLLKAADGTFALPCAPDGTHSHEGLLAYLTDQGLQPGPQTLYAVYEDTAAGATGIFYHGTMQGNASASAEFAPINALPFDRISNASERRMLQRYAKEYEHGSFGIYQGNQDTGTVHQLAPVTPQTR
ncbi:cag pathogenicity island protein Cag11 [Pseudorhodobacter turbinis]|uniref:Cag pathogenicity island protein Cag11 n=1 Tax=Pseudorhodobacter turbinis TaxID=2500533 RepID=A0A4P8EFJ3_9RHOB|nr:CoA transferase [Pseudorhodobacter turbinis]QCO55472.1 cag pathogenicity island protein Cag11 [Pseudorhodobacter turbinis]